jgi:hypothetical protein
LVVGLLGADSPAPACCLRFVSAGCVRFFRTPWQVDVTLVWHIRHANNVDGAPTLHRDEVGEVPYDEEYDDLKIIGIFSSESQALAAVDRARLRPGFRDEPNCFAQDVYTLDEDRWVEGFVTIPDDH